MIDLAPGTQYSLHIPLNIRAFGECKDEEEMTPKSARNSQWEEGQRVGRGDEDEREEGKSHRHAHVCMHTYTHALTSTTS